MELNWILILQLASISVVSGILYFWYFIVRPHYRYWSERGIDGPKPNLFRLGNMLDILSTPSVKLELDWQNRYGKLYGHYSTLQPVLTIADPELIKQVMVRDFSMFVNRRQVSIYHEIYNRSLFLLDDQHWKRVRTITSSTFSSGKLHSIIPLVDQCATKLMQNLDRIVMAGDDGKEVIETRDLITGFAIDVIASTSFGIETNTNIVDSRGKLSPTSSSTNPILINASNFNNSTPFQMLGIALFPNWLNNLFNIRLFFNRDAFGYFQKLIEQVISQRRKLEEQTGIESNKSNKRSDFVQLMLDARLEENELDTVGFDHLTATAEQQQQDCSTNPDLSGNTKNNKLRLLDTEIMAQGIAFFVAGFETTSATINYCLYELCFNQDIQQRLFEELDNVFNNEEDSNDDPEQKQKLCNRILNELPYLDAVIKETLRKYPPGVRIDRRVGVDGYRLSNVELKKGQIVEVSVYGVHHNPEYFPKPERFDPDRFMPENRHNLVPYSYIPFGVGPRNCIGMRFAYQEIKLLLARLVHRFHFSATKDTPIPIQYDVNAFVLCAKPFPVLIEKRSN